MKNRGRKNMDSGYAEFGCDDITEFMSLCTSLCEAAVRPQEDSVRSVVENAGYRILWFVWEERPKGTVCEIGLEQITAPHFEGESLLVDHFREILLQAQVEVRPEHMVVRRDSDHPGRMDVGFVDFARRK